MAEWFRRKSEKIKTLDKKEIAEGMWLKCPQCREVVYRTMLEENHYICINCTHHFRISSDDYIQLLLDDEEYEEIAQNVQPADPLNFKATKNYVDQIKVAQDQTGNKDAVKNVSFITCKDSLGQANAFRKGVQMITNWKDGDEDFGSVKNWTNKDVLVIDSLTLMGEAALRGALVFNNKKPTEQPSQPEWGTAARDVQHIIQYITGSEVPCNVVVTTHMQYMEGDLGVSKAYPTSVGSKLSTKIGRYFNCVCRIDTRSSSKGTERTLRTVSDHKMDLKVTAPSRVEANTECDLAKLFDAIQKNAQSKLNKDTGGK